MILEMTRYTPEGNAIYKNKFTLKREKFPDYEGDNGKTFGAIKILGKTEKVMEIKRFTNWNFQEIDKDSVLVKKGLNDYYIEKYVKKQYRFWRP